jgi:hypothetical protein
MTADWYLRAVPAGRNAEGLPRVTRTITSPVPSTPAAEVARDTGGGPSCGRELPTLSDDCGTADQQRFVGVQRELQQPQGPASFPEEQR